MPKASPPSPLDPLDGFDWNAHWGRLVQARQREAGPRESYWDRRAEGFAFSVRASDTTLPRALEARLAPHKTLVDVGAGAGRHAAPLADRLDWVTAVEPSQRMRDMIPARSNMTIVAATWDDADVARADLILCSHVLYGVLEPVPFIEKMEAAAKERVLVLMRDRPHRRPPDVVTEILRGSPTPRQVRFSDLYNLLHWMGRDPDVEVEHRSSLSRYGSMEMAIDDCRIDAGDSWDEVVARRWLEANLTLQPDGTFLYDAGEMVTGLAHWAPPAR